MKVSIHPQRFYIIILTMIIALMITLTITSWTVREKTKKHYSTILYDRHHQLMHAFLSSDEKWRMFTTLDEITPVLQKTILYKEDKYFRYHPGFNPAAMIRALFNNLSEGRRTSGASTITMQVARLLEPKPRTYRNKIREINRAIQIEWLFTKDEILQMYLNLAPFGGNIEGVKAASHLYFGKPPDLLSLAEVTLLSVIPNRPVSLIPGRSDEKLIAIRNQWLNKMKQDAIFDEQEIQDALNEPLSALRMPPPRYAPHLAIRLKNSNPESVLLHSTIDLGIQTRAEKLIREYINQLHMKGISNATAIIIHNPTHEVLAYIGSADFHSVRNEGQVDGIKAIRSPGSTLKPFLYGLAADQGLITPKYRLSDIPVAFGSYEPENYDGLYRGLVTAEEALAGSLNIPAVQLLNEYGVPKFLDFLAQAGFKSISSSRGELGLSVILGGCGVSLEELASAYTLFPWRGKYAPLRYLTNSEGMDTLQLISESSTWMMNKILTDLSRPELPDEWRNTMRMSYTAWKTGTSYGRHDAWSIGFNGDFTIGVWCGNFSGKGVPELNGREVATPLMLKLFNAIHSASNTDWMNEPDGISYRLVCSETGKVPGKYCNNFEIDYYIPGVSASDPCNHMITVWTNADSTLSYCSECLPENGYRKSIYPNFAPEMMTWMKKNGHPVRTIPPHNPDCESLPDGTPPSITSPVNLQTYYLPNTETDPLMLMSHLAADASRAYWYVNNKLVATSASGEAAFIRPPGGKIRIHCSDDKGRTSHVAAEIRFIDL
jgi:penicillin-binding protein 1C